jgi:hypothetical protein
MGKQDAQHQRGLLAALPGIGTWDTLEEISKLCGE